MQKTEQRNPKTTHIDTMETIDMLKIINEENRRSLDAVEEALNSIAAAVDAVKGDASFASFLSERLHIRPVPMGESAAESYMREASARFAKAVAK